jgi:hypothetical protein
MALDRGLNAGIIVQRKAEEPTVSDDVVRFGAGP